MRLVKISNNFHRLDGDELQIFFSYETPIASFERGTGWFISKNEWGTTTGKHLNSINEDKSIRIPHEEFMWHLEGII